MSRVVGIDFGTTNSVIAVLENGEPVVIPNSSGNRLTPSVVAFGENGELLVGGAAKNQSVINYERTVMSVKRKFGQDFSIDVDGREYIAEQIAAIIIERLKENAEDFIGEKVEQAIITVPAYFNDGHRNAVKRAGELAGLEVLRLINEPTAAALSYHINSDEDKTVLVFDLGGGTFDVSVLEVSETVYEVTATRGNNKLGGDDLDAVLIQAICKDFYKKHQIDLREDRMALQKIRDVAEQAKKDLSETDSTTIAAPFISADHEGPKHLNMNITRMEFENLIREYLNEMEELVDGALEDADVEPEEVDTVLLVGGSTRIPAVQNMLEAKFEGRVKRSSNPDECVATGAAIQGGIMSGDVRGLVLVDVTPLTLGIRNENDVFIPIIERNSCIPTRESKIFTTVTDNQVAVEVEVLQGERLRASANHSIGQFSLEGIKPQRRGAPRIEVMFDIDVNGIVHVSAKDKFTGQSQKIQVSSKNALDDEDVERIVQEAEAHREEDEVFVNRQKLVDQAQSLLEHLKENAGTGEGLDESSAEINELVEYIEKVLQTDDLQQIRNAIETMNVYLSEMVA